MDGIANKKFVCHHEDYCSQPGTYWQYRSNDLRGLKMDIDNIWVNRECQPGKWYPRTYCRKWHQRLRFWLVKRLLKSLYAEKDICWIRIDTSTS